MAEDRSWVQIEGATGTCEILATPYPRPRRSCRAMAANGRSVNALLPAHDELGDSEVIEPAS